MSKLKLKYRSYLVKESRFDLCLTSLSTKMIKKTVVMNM